MKKRPTLCQDGSCCGTNHVSLVRWKSGDPRLETGHQAIVLLAQWGHEYFDSHAIYRLLYAHRWGASYTVSRALDRLFPDKHKGHTVWEWLHTNGYVAWRPEERRGKNRWYLTDKAVGWLDAIGFDWRTVGQWQPVFCGRALYEWLVGPLDEDDRYLMERAA